MQNITLNDISSDRTNTRIITDGIPAPAATGDNRTETKRSASKDLTLRDIAIEQPFYMQKDIEDPTVAEKLQQQQASGQTGLAMKNSMVLASSGMTKQDFSRMEEDGFSPMDMDDEAIVTVADQIRINLAKGGADVSMMGDVSNEAIEAATGSTAAAKAVETAIAKASEITEVTDAAKKYLIKNELEPTIENVYKANFSVSEKYEYSTVKTGSQELSKEDMDELMPQIEGVIKKAGLAVSDETIDSAKWLLSQKMPLTPESLKEYMALSVNDLKTDESDIREAINEALIEGKKPEDAYIMDGYSTTEVARATVDMVNSITDTQIQNAVKREDPLTIATISSEPKVPDNDIAIKKGSKQDYELVSARRNLEEIRLSMTFEVSISMVRRGISIDTTELSDLVDSLKAEENRLYNSLFSGGSDRLTFEEKISIYEAANSSIHSLKSLPAAALAGFKSTTQITISTLSVEASSRAAKYKAAGETYEALMTAPRKDLGDSIKKAFRNVDDILEDLGFEPTESNERAVRILGYNSLSITRESVTEIRTADELLQRTFKNLTPGVVAQMVKDGDNPLDLSLEELNEKIDRIKQENTSTASEEQYADFLYKLDMKKGLSDEERQSFIGIYRLMHQVTESDGAVIGALLNQGAEVTMRNMMMAIRTERHKNREAVIDDSFGEISGFKKESLSITNQIEMAFQTKRMQDAREAVTPSKLAAFESEDAYMSLTPDALAQALEAMDESPEDVEASIRSQMERMQQAVTSEARVYEALRQFDIPTTPANLEAMNSFLADRNGVFRKPFSRTVRDEDLENIDTRELMADIMRRFGEAVKTPEDMADAQQKLAETATNVMKNMLVEQEVDHIDIRGMRVALTQIRMLGQIGQQAENYTIPIMVADENGTLNLKVVRGSSENNGLVDIAFNMDSTGPVNATFRYSAEGVSGNISCVKDSILETLQNMNGTLESEIESVAETSVSISYSMDISMTGESIYADKKPDFETTSERTPTQTSRLYGIAKAFIDSLGKIKI